MNSMIKCNDQVSYDESLIYVVTCRYLGIAYVVSIIVDFLSMYERS